MLLDSGVFPCLLLHYSAHFNFLSTRSFRKYHIIWVISVWLQSVELALFCIIENKKCTLYFFLFKTLKGLWSQCKHTKLLLACGSCGLVGEQNQSSRSAVTLHAVTYWDVQHRVTLCMVCHFILRLLYTYIYNIIVYAKTAKYQPVRLLRATFWGSHCCVLWEVFIICDSFC